MTNDYQQRLHRLVSELLQENAQTPREQTFQRVLGVVYTILENGSIEEILSLIS